MTTRPTVDEIFFEALDRAAGERDAYIRQVCRGDSALLDEVRSLVDAHEHAGAFLATPAVEAALGEAAGNHHDGNLGRQIGSYRLVERIGAGGMSRVYRAERADPQFTHAVAIKLVRRVFDDAEVLRRFRTECQALASLEHPNIARMIDWGIAADGTPYLIMECIDGVPIDEWCAERSLPMNARIDLFHLVCDAVHHAHKNSILHRDLKPSNILVTSEGRVKLLDFGIARFLDAAGSDDVSERTATGMQVMTPQYASPEQIRGESLSTSSDVYSLGVVLYKLLTGRLPFTFDNRTPGDWERIISAVTPTKPSDGVLTGSGHGRAPDSSARDEPTTDNADARRLARQLRGDLDTIAMMALRKEPSRRYGSAEQFAEDLGRYRRGLPVIAQTDTLGYRVRKFARRHRVGVAAVAAILLLLLGSTVGGFTLYAGAERARQAEVNARLVAEENAQTAEEVTTFLIDLFEVSDPNEAPDNTITVREVLDRGTERIETELADQPAVQARLLDAVGAVHRNLGLYPEARGLYEKAADLRRNVLESDRLSLATTLQQLAALYNDIGEYDSSLTVLGEVRMIQEELLGTDDVEVGKTLNVMGSVLLNKGILDSAHLVLERSIAIHEADSGPNARILAGPLNNLARTHVTNSDVQTALPLYERSLHILESTGDPNHPQVAGVLNNIAAAHYRLGEYGRALPYFQRSLGIMEAALGPDHPNVGTLIHNMAVVAKRAGELGEARTLYERSLAITRQALGAEHPDVGRTLLNLGGVLQELGDLEEALRLDRRALQILERGLGGDHAEVATALGNIGTVLTEMGRPGDARRTIERALTLNERRLGVDHPRVAFNLLPLAIIDRLSGRLDESDRRFRRAYGIIDANLSESHRERARCLVEWSLLAIAQENLDDAEERLRLGKETYARDLGADHPEVLHGEARFWALRGDADRALQLLRRAVDAGLPPGGLQQQEDLATLRGTAEFEAIVGREP